MKKALYSFFANNFKKRNLISLALVPVSFVYWVFFSLISFVLKKRQIVINPAKVICVGNIVCGGSGKTQFIISLIDLIKKKNIDFSVCIVSKGYGRKSSGVFFVPKNSSNFTPEQIGDEPYLLSSFADIYITNSRSRIGNKIRKYDFIILDDGFQDEKIFKNLNILMFDANYFIGNGFLLPAGPLRSGFSAIKNADLIVLNNFDSQSGQHEENLKKLQTFKISTGCNFEIFTSNTFISSLHNKSTKYIAFSGLGDNDKFFNLLRKNDFDVQEALHFPDHHFYSKQDINKIYRKIFNIKGRGITTRKDLVKIERINYKFDSNVHDKMLAIIKEQNFVECLDVSIKLDNEDLFFDTLMKKIKIY